MVIMNILDGSVRHKALWWRFCKSAIFCKLDTYNVQVPDADQGNLSGGDLERGFTVEIMNLSKGSVLGATSLSQPNPLGG